MAWGGNYYGQANVPAPNTGFVAGAAGENHSLGLKADADGDRVPDATDNCPFLANRDQWDCNDDGMGDACTIADCSGDPGCADCNSNAIPDECEALPDADVDGAPDCDDLCPGVDDTIFAPQCAAAIPTASTWGLVVLTLVLLSLVKIHSIRRGDFASAG